MSDVKQPWIKIGYQTFATLGPDGLKIEALARAVGKSKSSFYHLFATMEIFQRALLNYHLERAKAIATEAQRCQSMVPDLLNLFLEIREDILFHKQLRIHRTHAEFEEFIQKAHKPVEEAFLSIWISSLNLEGRKGAAEMMLKLTIENFYLRVSDKTLTYEWLLSYLQEIQQLVRMMD